MASVTQRIKEIKQPYGGYLKPSEFEKIEYKDEYILEEENINAGLVGIAVDYMTRFIMGANLNDAFKISLLGAITINDIENARKLLSEIDGLNDKSIINACKLVGYDVCFRFGRSAYKDVNEINPDPKTINNIRIMINRSIKFFEEYGPIVKDGFTFEGGYTNVIDSGDGDFLTSDTLWDFKVSSKSPTSSHTLQLLIYYIMGKHSINEEFKKISKLGIFNPRLNVVFLKQIKDISQDIIEEVSNKVIGYKKEKTYNSVNNKIDLTNYDLTINDVMNILHCSRYKVMKYYSEEDLPLYKNKNKYYINQVQLYKWIELKEKERRKQLIFTLLFMTVFIIFMFVIIFSII